MDPIEADTVHPDLEPLAFLLGSWRGDGEGRFHSTGPFEFQEEIRFSHRGRPWLVYEQRAWSPETGEAMHTEMGFWRLVDGGMVNAFIAITAGLDFAEGKLEGRSISLHSTASPMAAGVEKVNELAREYRVDDDMLTYSVDMGTEAQPTQWHIGASLRRS